MKNKDNKPINELISRAVESMAVAVSIIDTEGTLVYYNRQAETILDRKPEYIGNDIRTHHNNPASNQKIDRMLKAFKKGKTQPFHYEAKPYGETIGVTLSPIFKDGTFIGITQSVQLKQKDE